MKRFSKRVEDFVCEKCGAVVTGTGYTDHCPKCLWGKHVDVNPGDRACECHGLLRPVGVEQKRGEYVIRYRCEKCGLERRNRAAESDDFNVLLRIARSET